MSRESDVPDRDHLIDRLQHLRTIVPVFAQELASARRQAVRLRAENDRLLAEVRRLQLRSSATEEIRPGKLAGAVAHDTNTNSPRHDALEGVPARTLLEPASVISSLDIVDTVGSSAELAT